MNQQRLITPAQALKLTGLLALLGGGYLSITSVDMEQLLQPDKLIKYLDTLGELAPVGFILMMALAVVVSPIPSLPLDLAAGIAFGPMMGALYAVIGAEIGAILSFLIGRALGREALSRLLRVNIVFCEKCTDHQLMGLIFLARLLPIFSFDIVSYGAGLTNMSLKAFALATLVGMIPPTFALTTFGGSLVTVEWPLILSGLALTGLFLFLPAVILKNRSAWWVQLMQGNMPTSSPKIQAELKTSEPSATTCPSCGEPF